MGLTIHFTISPQPSWSWSRIHDTLADAREFISGLPGVKVGKLIQFQGKSCQPLESDQLNIQRIKLQAQRSVTHPYFPGVVKVESPEYIACLAISIADSCPILNIGVSQHSPITWQQVPVTEDMYVGTSCMFPNWPAVLQDRKTYPASLGHIKGFMKKWHLRKLPKGPANRPNGINWKETNYRYDVGQACLARAGMVKHTGMKQQHGMLCLFHPFAWKPLWLRHSGTHEVAERIMADGTFHSEIRELIEGHDDITTAGRNWKSFCETEKANNPSCGGIDNFVKAHLTVCSVLEYLQVKGLNIVVDDETRFWNNRKVAPLAQMVTPISAEVYNSKSVMDTVVDKIGDEMMQAIFNSH